MLVSVEFGHAMQTGHALTSAQISICTPSSSETLTADGTTTATAPASNRPMAVRIVTDTAIYVSAGSAPDASAAPRRLMLANTEATFGCNTGDAIDVVTVA